MALLQKLKSLLGFDGSDSEHRRSREVGVTVERDGTTDDGPGTAVDETRDRREDKRAEAPQSAATDTEDEPPAQVSDSSSAVESDAADVETTTAATETTEDTDDALAPDIEPEPKPDAESETEPEPNVEAESKPDAEPESEPELESAVEETEREPVDEIKGIGPAYADRLSGAGVETVAELAASDATELSEQTDISEKRIQGWIDRAEVR